jgi:hypothetical protein
MYDSIQSSLIECTPYSPSVVSSSRRGWCRPIYMALPHKIGKFRQNSTPADHPFWYPTSLLPTAPPHHRSYSPLRLADGCSYSPTCPLLLNGVPAPTHWHGICCFLVGPLVLPAAPPHRRTCSGSPRASSPVCQLLLTARPAPRRNSSQAVGAISIKMSIPVCEV